MTRLHRVFVEKRPGFRAEAAALRSELEENLSIDAGSLRVLNVYDLEGFGEELLEKAAWRVFAEKATDDVTVSQEAGLAALGLPEGAATLAIEYLPGQFDQRAASACDCVRLLDPSADVRIKSSRLLVFPEGLGKEQLDMVRHYEINAVECREKDLGTLSFSDATAAVTPPVLEGFLDMDAEAAKAFIRKMGLAMNLADLEEIRRYFRAEGRIPTETELRILDTYWSDHCRHTTFTTNFTSVEVAEGWLGKELGESLQLWLDMRAELGRESKPLCLMDLATIGGRYLRKKGLLDDMEVSEENNACSIFVNITVDGKPEKWLLMFKNETHNHPTEIEPFGGAATCLGGAIRDPLSGRSYVYQAMRVTGAGDIWKPVSETMPGKLPQRVISRKAAQGYSSYGNQIGLATGEVHEIIHPGYVAKRMEIGAVAGAVKASAVRRESPAPGDVVLLLGGRTGRDGIGGATGASKEHDSASLESCGSEVQKGNPTEERKLQRLFRRSDAVRLIKKSNDFGAGGVSVAVGELADGLDIDLDKVPVKYSGINCTELAISESQERMAVVVAAADAAAFEELCRQENVEVSHVATVTGEGRMRIFWRGLPVADLKRSFIDSAGASREAKAFMEMPAERNPFAPEKGEGDLRTRILALMKDPSVASQRGLGEMFDSTIGRGTVLMPYTGLYQATPSQVSVQKLPCDGFSQDASLMSWGFDPYISEWSPYHGAAYAVIEACAKAVAAGASHERMRFSYQEYFQRMTGAPEVWGRPLSALLGALKMQKALGLPAIGGKDSMSGTFEDRLHVPPTLVAFGVAMVGAPEVISPEFKKAGNKICLFRHVPLANHMPDTEALQAMWKTVHAAVLDGSVVAAYALGRKGLAEAVCKMCFGNGTGARINGGVELFGAAPGGIIAECTRVPEGAELIGEVTADGIIDFGGSRIGTAEAREACEEPFSKVYPLKAESSCRKAFPDGYREKKESAPVFRSPVRVEHPLVYIPVFPGTNCDYDMAKAFRAAGARTEFGVFRNLSSQDIFESIEQMRQGISDCQILALSGGFSAGDEPDGSGKFIANILADKEIAAEIDRLLERGGLILGICNGFQALVKSGLLPYGHCRQVSADSPTLFRNDIGRHISRMALTRVASVKSPWLAGFSVGDTFNIPVSHGEGKFVVDEKQALELFRAGQVAFQYADPLTGEATMECPLNPNGSCYAIEGILSPDGLILGKMGHSERWEDGLLRGMPGNLHQGLFENAVNYFKHNR